MKTSTLMTAITAMAPKANRSPIIVLPSVVAKMVRRPWRGSPVRRCVGDPRRVALDDGCYEVDRVAGKNLATFFQIRMQTIQ